jgi:hypothetical protein
MSKREVPKYTKLNQLKKIGGFDLGLYYHEDETHKWRENIDTFERMTNVIIEQLERMKKELGVE